jgi:hypothetical protein
VAGGRKKVFWLQNISAVKLEAENWSVNGVPVAHTQIPNMAFIEDCSNGSLNFCDKCYQKWIKTLLEMKIFAD